MDETTTDTSGAETRIRQLIAANKALEAQVASLQETATQADKWRTELEAAQTSHAQALAAAQLERQILAAGITDAEGIDAVQTYYGRLPADGRPPVGEWLAAKDSLPRAVRAYMAEPPVAQTTPVAPAPVQMPKQHAGVVQTPTPAPTAWSAEAISRLSPEEFRANRAAIMASLGTP